MTAPFFDTLGWVSLSSNLKESFNKTLQDAEQHRHGTIEIEHLLFSLIDDPEGAIALTTMGMDRDELRDTLADHLDAIPAGSKVDPKDVLPTRSLKKLMARASDQADNEHDDHIDGGDVIRALADFKASNSNLDFLHALQAPQENPEKPAPRARTRSQKVARPTPVAPEAGDEIVDTTAPLPPTPELNFDADPIRASIKAIMARRSEAEKVLFECEWYHLFKSLNMIDEVLEGEEQLQRARLLARAEKELAERPRCRKAFMYVRHLDKELARLKGIVDIDWAGDFTPDEPVSTLDRLQSMPRAAEPASDPASSRSELEDHLFDVKIQASEVMALEQKLLRLDETAGPRQERLKEMESDLESHDTHSKKRENVIGELERYLRSEMQMADARDQRIIELEKDLVASKTISDSQVDKTSHLEHELKSFKDHAGNREMRIAELEARLKSEISSATSHEEQVRELHIMLANEKKRAEVHDEQIGELQKTYEEEKTRAQTYEQQAMTLEEDLKSRLEQLQVRENHIKNLQENLSAKENHMAAREEQVKKLEADLSEHENLGEQLKHEVHTLASTHETQVQTLKSSHDNEVLKLMTSLEDQEGESRQHQQEISALRAQLMSLETRLQDQETAYSVEKVNLANTIEQLRQKIEDSERLVEIIHAPGAPYRLQAKTGNGDDALAESIVRRTIPVAKRHDS